MNNEHVMSDLQWYAVYTSSRAEKKVKERLDEQGISNYLPLKKEIRIWSDRKKKVSIPLIAGYIFVHTSPEHFTKVSQTQGVVAFLREKSKPVIIPDNQISRMRLMVDHALSDVEFIHDPLEVGDKVVIRQGELRGLIGDLIEIRGRYFRKDFRTTVSGSYPRAGRGIL